MEINRRFGARPTKLRTPGPPSNRGRAGRVEDERPPPGTISTRESIHSRRLHYAGLLNDARLVEALLASGAAIDARDARGRTPLACAAAGASADAANALLRLGADPTAADDAGVSPLAAAEILPPGPRRASLLAALGDASRPGTREGTQPSA